MTHAELKEIAALLATLALSLSLISLSWTAWLI
jgi:hypothetical protein